MAVFIPDVKPEDFNNSPGEKEVYILLLPLTCHNPVSPGLNDILAL